MKAIKLFSITMFLAVFTACAQQSGASYKDIDANTMELMISEKGGVVLDVRTPQEISKGHVENAQFMDFLEDDFSESLNSLPKDQPVYVYCWKGGRSADAAEIMVKKGFKNVYNLDGGFAAWQSANKKVVPFDAK